MCIWFEMFLIFIGNFGALLVAAFLYGGSLVADIFSVLVVLGAFAATSHNIWIRWHQSRAPQETPEA